MKGESSQGMDTVQARSASSSHRLQTVLKGKSVSDLQFICAKRGLSADGTRAILLQRLCDNLGG